MRTALLAASATVVCLGLAACSSGPPPGVTVAAPPQHDPHVISGARNGVTRAVFELATGVTTLVVHTGDLKNDGLYVLSTPTGAGQLPTAVVSDGQVVAQTVSSGVNGPSVLDVELADDVAWTIHLDGGSTTATLDLRNGGVAAIAFGAGVSRIDTTLPKENTPIAVQMAGGSSTFSVHAPTGVPARVTMAGGGGSATIDGTAHSGIAGGTVFTPDGWTGSGSAIDIDNTSGVGTFTLDRY